MLLQRTSTAAESIERVRLNQRQLAAALKSDYDFIVCGSGSSGSVVVRRLAENPAVSVPLLEAGGSDDVPSVTRGDQWFLNLGSERTWNFRAQPNPHLNGRCIPLEMGKVLGGGSSINLMTWARGHRNDWDYFASEAGETRRGTTSRYRRSTSASRTGMARRTRTIAEWEDRSSSSRRGTPTRSLLPWLKERASVGIPTFQSNNGRMMEGDGGASILDKLVRDGRRQSIFRAYAFPYMDRPNLTVLSHALATRVTFDDDRATGVECIYRGTIHRFGAALEVVLSLGAIHTPKVFHHAARDDWSHDGTLRRHRRASRGDAQNGSPTLTDTREPTTCAHT